MKSSHLYHLSVYLAVVSATLLIPVTSKAIVISGPITNPANGHVYYLLDTAFWTDSEAEALTLGGHLVTINDAAEDSFVFTTFSPIVSTLVPDRFTSLWIGLNDAAIEGTFVWASGESSAYSNWHPGNPQSTFADEDYVGILVNPSFGIPGLWHDIVSDGHLGDVVFGVVEVVPEPSTLLLFVVGIIGIALYGWWRRKKAA